MDNANVGILSAELDDNEWESQLGQLFKQTRELQKDDRKEHMRNYKLYEGQLQFENDSTGQNSEHSDLLANLHMQPFYSACATAAKVVVTGQVTLAKKGLSADEVKKLKAAYGIRLQSTLRYTKFADDISRATRDALICGEGYMHCGIRQNHDDQMKELYFEHRDWKDIWADPNSRQSDLSDAAYLFDLEREHYYDIQALYPSHAAKIKDLAQWPHTSPTAKDHSYAADASKPYSGTQEHEKRDRMLEPDGLYIIKAYVKTQPSGGKMAQLWLTTFVADASMTRLHMLERKRFELDHERIPFCRVTFSYFNQKSGVPYSLLTPKLEKLEKRATTLLRKMVRLALDIANKTDPAQYNVSVETGELGCVDEVLEAKRVEYDRTTKEFDEIMSISKIIASKFRGDTARYVVTHSTTEYMIENIEQIQSSLHANIAKTTQGMYQMLLSMMEQYAGQIQYYALAGPNKTFIPIDMAEESTMKGSNVGYIIIHSGINQ